ncbi:winged helix DNA-binding protein [Streptomyces sp. 130]|uniref:winged helix DNA-binding protein n=1 Tax=Streptomyces sp. 130 TaxID=2591006 RepID=UPI00117FECB6|nr:winged helix DNA-binding protein [Streptomyces sp. 130]TRV73260.1 winged helix DNA-binding protein [Streptomyces sp. 130]
MTTTPTLNGQVIGMAHYATRAVAERLLTQGITFHQSLALNAVDAKGGTVERVRLVERLTGAAKLDVAVAERTITELTSAGLLAERDGDGPLLALTPAGESLVRTHRAALAEVTAKLYGDLPAEDLAAAGRVLTEVTARADAMLAAG